MVGDIVNISTLVSLIFFIYTVGASYTLIGIIIWDGSKYRRQSNIEEDIRMILLWPLTWLVLGIFTILITYEWIEEKVQDTRDNIRWMIKRRKGIR